MNQFKNKHPYDEPDFAQVTTEALVQLGFPQFSNETGATIFYEQQNRPRPMPPEPDLIIEQLSDLLDIFLEAGVQ